MSCNECVIENELEEKCKVNLLDCIALIGSVLTLFYLISIA